MPLYEYKCKRCGHSFEHLARTHREPAPQCPKCGARNPKKRLSAFSTSAGSREDTGSCSTGTCPTGTCSL